jgi:hypothetical protein
MATSTQQLFKSKHFVDIKSSDAGPNSQSNNFAINFNNNNFCNVGTFSDNSKVYFSPISCSFPNSWYNITTQNNSVTIGGNALFTTAGSNGTQTKKVTIPPGYYNIAGLVAAWAEALNTDAQYYRLSDGTQGAQINWDVTFDINSRTITIYVDTSNFPNVANHILSLSFDVDTRKTFGFLMNIFFIRTAQNAAVVDSFSGQLIPDLQPIERVVIKSNLAKRCFSMRNDSLNLNDTLFSFPIDNNLTGNQVVWNAMDYKLFRQEIDNNFQIMTVQVCDQNGNLIPFDGEFTMSFIIERETVENYASSKKAQLLADYGSYAAQNK